MPNLERKHCTTQQPFHFADFLSEDMLRPDVQGKKSQALIANQDGMKFEYACNHLIQYYSGNCVVSTLFIPSQRHLEIEETAKFATNSKNFLMLIT